MAGEQVRGHEWPANRWGRHEWPATMREVGAGGRLRWAMLRNGHLSTRGVLAALCARRRGAILAWNVRAWSIEHGPHGREQPGPPGRREVEGSQIMRAIITFIVRRLKRDRAWSLDP